MTDGRISSILKMKVDRESVLAISIHSLNVRYQLISLRNGGTIVIFGRMVQRRAGAMIPMADSVRHRGSCVIWQRPVRWVEIS